MLVAKVYKRHPVRFFFPALFGTDISAKKLLFGMKIARVFVFLIGSQAVTAALLARGDATVERDLSFASSNLTALDTTLRTFVQSGGSLSQALVGHTIRTILASHASVLTLHFLPYNLLLGPAHRVLFLLLCD